MSGECILVVDDSSAVRSLLSEELLPLYGYQSQSATHGREALRVIAEGPVDLVLLDLQMPDISGIEVLRKMREQQTAVPVILMTAHGSESIAAEAFRLGASDYLIKPFDTGLALSTINRVLDQVRLQREKEQLGRELEQARHGLEQRVRELNVLVGISKSVTSQLNLDRVLDRVVEGAVFIARAEEGGLWLLEAEADELHLKAERGLGPARQHLSLLGAEMGLVGQTLRAAEPLWLVAEGGDPDIQVTTGYEVRAFLSVPLVNKGHAVGVLSVSNRAQGRRFTSNDKALIEALADYAVIAIENARMYRATDQALAERVEEVTHLYDIARTVTCTLDPETIFDLVTAKISEMFQVEAGSLLLLDDEAQELEFVTSWMGDQEPLRGVRLKAGQGIVGQVALSHQPAVVNDAYSHSNFCSQVDRETGFVTRSILCVPLVVQDRCTGVLELLNKVDGPFTQEDVERLGNVARPVAIALENARLYREAQELHMAKSRFVSTVARELRSPLTAIKGYSSMLLSGAMGNLEGRAAEGIRKVEASTEYLIDLMEDMLDIARLETGDTRLDLQPVSIGQIVTQISSSFKQRVRDKNLRLAARVSPRLPPVYGDQDRISQILNNLVTNAYLYTLPKGRIAIEARDERNKKRPRGSGEWVVVSVSDTGIGIAAEDQDLIFKRFFRAEHPVVRHHQGRGLSLSIAKSLVELHGGRIWFESTPGVGSTFSFALPVAG